MNGHCSSVIFLDTRPVAKRGWARKSMVLEAAEIRWTRTCIFCWSYHTVNVTEWSSG